MEDDYQKDCLIEAMKRIVLTGAECTGKSTLAKALSGYYGEPWTTEFVRSYVDQLDRELIQADLEEIFCGQIAAEDAGWAKSKRFVIHDTNLLSSIIYANHYFAALRATKSGFDVEMAGNFLLPRFTSLQRHRP